MGTSIFLGNHGDWEAADETAHDMMLDMNGRVTME